MDEELSVLTISAGLLGLVVLCTLVLSLDSRAARPYAIPTLILATIHSCLWVLEAPCSGPPVPDRFSAMLVFFEFFCVASVVMLLVMLPLSFVLHYLGPKIDRLYSTCWSALSQCSVLSSRM